MTQSEAQHEWERGYYCAVAAVLRENGFADTFVRKLFEQGGGAPEHADAEDVALFREHGLMQPNARGNRGEPA